MGKWFSGAERVRRAMDKAGAALTDADASQAVELYASMRYDGLLIPAGTRINWGGQLKRAAADVWDTEANSPDKAPSLWEDIAYKDGYRLIPEVITAGLAFALGERGWWAGSLYESLLAANVNTPAAYPPGWKLV